mmetsp:Transcript_40516/g.75935  ORF Transcript_40516/g.75935 Transcript_40516/m.75935 type:complete len:207 (-) Transcript_40516:76-696(-)
MPRELSDSFETFMGRLPALQRRAAASLFFHDDSSPMLAAGVPGTDDMVHENARMSRARHQGTSFLFVNGSSNGAEHAASDSLAIPSALGRDHVRHFAEAQAPVEQLTVTSFHMDTGAGALEGEAEQLAHNPAALIDPFEWVKIASELATVGNFLALVLTFVAAAYHAYGYVQYKRALEQQKNAGGGHGGHGGHGGGHGDGGHGGHH